VRVIGLGRRFQKGDAKPDIRALPSQEELRRLFDYDPLTGELRWQRSQGSRLAGALAGRIRPDGYLIVGISRVYYLSHRLIWKMVLGSDPVAFVDHRDGNKLNNRWDNLRAATNGQNLQNSKLRRDNTSGVKGVHPYRNRWVATISAGHGQIILGRFISKQDAIAVRAKAEKTLHGQYAKAEVS
jgi:hypothetical protein